jgi:hypothetical protein
MAQSSFNFQSAYTHNTLGSIQGGQAGEYYHLTKCGYDSVKYAGDYANLSSAVASIGATSTTLIITDGQSISSDVTIPANVFLKIIKGGSIAIATTKTLTINGPFEAGLYQVFICTGTGKVIFGAGVVGMAAPQWWGAKGDGSNDDTTAIKNALSSYDSYNTHRGGVVYFPPGTYLVTPYVHPVVGVGYYAGMWIPTNITIQGSGINSTTIKLCDNSIDSSRVIWNYDIAPNFYDENICIRNILVDGNNLNQGTNGVNTGIDLWRARNCYLENVKVINVLGSAGSGTNEGPFFNCGICTNIHYINCIAAGTTKSYVNADNNIGKTCNGFNHAATTNVTYTNCVSYGMSATVGAGTVIGLGFNGNGSSQVRYVNCHAFLNDAMQMGEEVSQNVSFANCWSGGIASPSAGNQTPKEYGTGYDPSEALFKYPGASGPGFILNGGTHITILGGGAELGDKGVWIANGADYISLCGVDLVNSTVPVSGACTHLSIRGCSGVSDNTTTIFGNLIAGNEGYGQVGLGYDDGTQLWLKTLDGNRHLRLSANGSGAIILDLPSFASGLPTGALWYDPSDSNRIKRAP